ncbi:MAG: type II secretion system protein [Bacilli bacterium]|nr:type II secretion system protein [Bacilli bacterium]
MKKGFTLVEIIAVITVMSILLVIITPYILNTVNNKKGEISNEAKQIIYDATDLYVKENQDNYPTVANSIYCIKLETLVKNGKLEAPIKDMKSDKEIPLTNMIKVTIDDYNQYNYELVNKCEE